MDNHNEFIPIIKLFSTLGYTVLAGCENNQFFLQTCQDKEVIKVSGPTLPETTQLLAKRLDISIDLPKKQNT